MLYKRKEMTRMRPALLVIDAQKGWLDISDGLRWSVDKHIDKMREAISLFRKAGAPIIFSYHSVMDRGIVEGSKDFELLPGIDAQEEDGNVVKIHLNAFCRTGLDTLLKDKECDTVMIIGLSAVHCVLATYFGAYDKDIVPYLVRGAVAGSDEESVQKVESICDTLSLRAISQIL